MFCEEADSLISSLDCLDHLPACSVFSYEVSLSQFSYLIVGRTFSINDCFKIFEGKGILILITSGLFFLFIIIFITVELGNVARHWVAIHIVLHITHVTDNTRALATA